MLLHRTRLEAVRRWPVADRLEIDLRHLAVTLERPALPE
jgi:hypothetical protein